MILRAFLYNQSMYLLFVESDIFYSLPEIWIRKGKGVAQTF